MAGVAVRARRDGRDSGAVFTKTTMIESVDGFALGKKRRALSSACVFFHGLGQVVVGGYYVAQPSESLQIIADAWGVDLQTSGDAYVLARNLVAVAAVYLAVWGLVCMVLATAAPPRTKRLVAALNLAAAVAVAACSSVHPEAAAAARCLRGSREALACLQVAAIWHLPFVVLDVLGIAFAEAGPRRIRVDAKTAILLNGQVSEQVRNTRITKIDSSADLIEYADSEVANTHAEAIPAADREAAKDYAAFLDKKKAL